VSWLERRNWFNAFHYFLLGCPRLKKLELYLLNFSHFLSSKSLSEIYSHCEKIREWVSLQVEEVQRDVLTNFSRGETNKWRWSCRWNDYTVKCIWKVPCIKVDLKRTSEHKRWFSIHFTLYFALEKAFRENNSSCWSRNSWSKRERGWDSDLEFLWRSNRNT
jgi:hypothetical protein